MRRTMRAVDVSRARGASASFVTHGVPSAGVAPSRRVTSKLVTRRSDVARSRRSAVVAPTRERTAEESRLYVRQALGVRTSAPTQDVCAQGARPVTKPSCERVSDPGQSWPPLRDVPNEPLDDELHSHFSGGSRCDTRAAQSPLNAAPTPTATLGAEGDAPHRGAWAAHDHLHVLASEARICRRPEIPCSNGQGCDGAARRCLLVPIAGDNGRLAFNIQQPPLVSPPSLTRCRPLDASQPGPFLGCSGREESGANRREDSLRG